MLEVNLHMHPVTVSGTAGRRLLSLEAILRIHPVSVTSRASRPTPFLPMCV